MRSVQEARVCAYFCDTPFHEPGEGERVSHPVAITNLNGVEVDLNSGVFRLLVYYP